MSTYSFCDWAKAEAEHKARGETITADNVGAALQPILEALPGTQLLLGYAVCSLLRDGLAAEAITSAVRSYQPTAGQAEAIEAGLADGLRRFERRVGPRPKEPVTMPTNVAVRYACGAPPISDEDVQAYRAKKRRKKAEELEARPRQRRRRKLPPIQLGQPVAEADLAGLREKYRQVSGKRGGK